MSLAVVSKAVSSKPMTRSEYNEFRGWELPSDENGSDSGFLIQDLNSSETNVEGEIGYISWVPTNVFYEGFKTSGSMSLGDAIVLVKNGLKVSRKGWNGADMFVYLVQPNSYFAAQNPNSPVSGMFPDDMVPYDGYLAIRTAKGTIATWSPSCGDALAEDWCIYEEATFEDRLKEEESTLQDKVDKLTAFTHSEKFSGIDNTQQLYLHQQLGDMNSYLSTLGRRIYHLNINKN